VIASTQKRAMSGRQAAIARSGALCRPRTRAGRTRDRGLRRSNLRFATASPGKHTGTIMEVGTTDWQYQKNIAESLVRKLKGERSCKAKQWISRNAFSRRVMTTSRIEHRDCGVHTIRNGQRMGSEFQARDAKQKTSPGNFPVQ
jgi:hypothetical protein